MLVCKTNKPTNKHEIQLYADSAAANSEQTLHDVLQMSVHVIFVFVFISKTSPDFSLCWLWLTHGSCVGPTELAQW